MPRVPKLYTYTNTGPEGAPGPWRVNGPGLSPDGLTFARYSEAYRVARALDYAHATGLEKGKAEICAMF